MYLLLVIVLVLLLIGALPHWTYMSGLSYGYYPSTLIGVVVVLLIILMLLGRI